MLIGPGTRIVRPNVPDESTGLSGIYQYLKELDRTLAVNYSNIVFDTFGIIGIRGLSSDGISSNNFVKSLDISSVCTVSWAFTNMEVNATYMLFVSTFPTNIGMATARNVTGVDFTFGPKTPSGMILNVLLLR